MHVAKSRDATSKNNSSRSPCTRHGSAGRRRQILHVCACDPSRAALLLCGNSGAPSVNLLIFFFVLRIVYWKLKYAACYCNTSMNDKHILWTCVSQVATWYSSTPFPIYKDWIPAGLGSSRHAFSLPRSLWFHKELCNKLRWALPFRDALNMMCTLRKNTQSLPEHLHKLCWS